MKMLRRHARVLLALDRHFLLFCIKTFADFCMKAVTSTTIDCQRKINAL